MKRFLSAFFLCCLIFFLSITQVSAYYNNMNASMVIGQSDFTSVGSNQNGNPGPNTLRFPTNSLIVGSKFVVADQANNRVLIWNTIPTSSNASADVVIGQINFSNVAANQGGTAAANTLRAPTGLASDGQRLLVSETNNHRVLIFNQLPTTNNASADVVIGQANFSSVTANQGGSVSANAFSAPAGIFYDKNTGKLLINDFNNSRVLIFNNIPTSNNASADVVVGQADFTHGSVNQGGSVAANTIQTPIFSTIYNNKLFVSDFANHRTLIFNSIPTSNNASADVVIGQADFTHNSTNQGGAVGANTLIQPRQVQEDKGRLFLNDSGNFRTLIYNQVPTSNNASADIVIGQQNFSSRQQNQGLGIGPNVFGTAYGLMLNENKMYISDSFYNRVLVFNDDQTAPGLSLGLPQGADNNLTKLSGNASTITNYIIRNVQYMVNGGGFNNATDTDGSFDTGNENFFFTFDPKSNNNTNDGYTIQVKSTTSNADTSDHLFYFQPFNLNTPEDRSFLSKALPTFSFSVNKQQTQLNENLSKYVVMAKKYGGDWVNYVDNIPVDYNSVKNSPDNLQSSSLNTDGNGTYEDKKILVVYSNNNSTLTVTPKAADNQGNANSLTFDQNGKLLNNGGYEWKVQAVDKNGHIQETETRKFVVGSSQFSNGSNWFPLQINSISGLGRVYLSTINPQLVKPKYRIQTSNPIFKGIATANSIVQLDLTNQTCQAKGESNCVQTFTANTNGASQFSLITSTNTLRSGNTYQAQFSVTQNGLFNALPPFLISR